MSIPRLDHATHIADRLNELSSQVKTRSRASLTDANHILETISARFFNALFGWNLVNLNSKIANYPAADLGDAQQRIAIQITNQDASEKIRYTASKAIEHDLGKNFTRLIIFFLLERKPAFPKKFEQPKNGPKIESWDVADLLEMMQRECSIENLERARKILDEEMGKVPGETANSAIHLCASEASLFYRRKAPKSSALIELSRLPPTNEVLFGRNEELKLLDESLNAPATRIIVFVAWGGVGKTALVNNWLRNLQKKDYLDIERIFGWSFYSQGTERQSPTAELFVKAAAEWFGEESTSLATSTSDWERAQKLTQLVQKQRTLLILDGLEPLQFAPGPREGQLRERVLQLFLRNIASQSDGLCVITTRIAVTDLQDYLGASVRQVDLEHLTEAAGIQLLQAFQVFDPLVAQDGPSDEMIAAVKEYEGHSLSLTVLGSYLKRRYNGDVRRRKEIPDLPSTQQGAKLEKMLCAYANWLCEENKLMLKALQIMGLFDRPAKRLEFLAIASGPPIRGWSEGTEKLGIDEWEESFANLREIKLLSPSGVESDSIDAHPLVREFFGKHFESLHPVAWREANYRLYIYFRNSGLTSPENIQQMEPFLRAIVLGCRAGRYREVFHEIYLPKIMRNDEHFIVRNLGALSPLLAALACFFEDRGWTRPVATGEQSLSNEDQYTILSQAGTYLSASRGWGSPEVRGAFSAALDRAKSSMQCFQALRGLWSFHLVTAEQRFNKALEIAQECLSIANQTGLENLKVEAKMVNGIPLFYQGRIKEARRFLDEACAEYDPERHRRDALLFGMDPLATSGAYRAVLEWIVGTPEKAKSMADEAVAVAKRTNHAFTISIATYTRLLVLQCCEEATELLNSADEVIAHAEREGFLWFRLLAGFLRGWAMVQRDRSLDGIKLMENSLTRLGQTGTVMARTQYSVLLADAYLLLNQPERAKILLDAAFNLHNTFGDKSREPELYRVKANLLKACGSFEDAEEAYLKSIEIAEIQGAVSFRLKAQSALTEFRLKIGPQKSNESK